MEYNIGLNEIINKIEENLINEINYKDLAKIIGVSDYTLQRIFCFLTGMTITEYIRKRRLSKAAEDIRITDDKIIDIAIKYCYDSPVAFSRAFYKMHGVKPKDVRKNNLPTKAFPKIEFEEKSNAHKTLEYRILDLPKQTLFGKSTKDISLNDKESIKEIWENSVKNKTLDYIIENSNQKELYYGASIVKPDETMKYYILGTTKKKGFEKLEIPSATWVAFKINSKEQKDILEVINIIYSKWLPESSYKIVPFYPELEIYYKHYCEYLIAIQK